ncbi:MAG: HEAT repeat domain-containing protein [Planctomycetota bacterium]
MRKTLLVWALTGVCATGLLAGDFESDVNDLGGPEKPAAADRSRSAVDKIREAGVEAYKDLIEGLNTEMPTDATKSARVNQIRQHCAELLGALGDSRATDDLLKHFDKHRAADSEYPEFGSRCAYALGQIWADKKADNTRAKVVGALSACAEEGTANAKISRYASLRGLALMKVGGILATKLITPADEATPEEPLIQQAAIEVIRASNTKSAAAQLVKIWETQAAGELKDMSKSVGVTAVFALAEFKDVRAIAGLVEILTNTRAFPNEPTLKNEATRLLQDKALSKAGIDALVAVFVDEEKQTQWGTAASALGSRGAGGVTALLAVSDLPVPEGKPDNHYSRRVEDNLRQLNSDDALAAFADAYRNVGENKDLRLKLIEQLLRYRTDIKKADAGVFKEGANDDKLEAPKRGECVAAYANLMGKDGFKDLKAWVANPEAVVRAEAVTGLGSTAIPLSKSVDVLKSVLADRNPDYFKARENALNGLKRSSDKGLLPLFLESMDPEIEKSADVRNRAILNLRSYRLSSGVDEEDMIDDIKGRLSDEDEEVRSTALDAYIPMATNLGNTEDAVKAVEAGMTDAAKSVRKMAYRGVGAVRNDVDPGKVVDQALTEETLEMRKEAITALSNLENLPEAEEKQRGLSDLCVNVLMQESNNGRAQDLLKNVVDKTPKLYSDVKQKARDEITALKGRGEYQKIVGWITVLMGIRDHSYVDEVKSLAEQDNTELRRKCVAYMRENGGMADADWLRTLRDRTDRAAAAVKGDIEAAIKHLESQ